MSDIQSSKSAGKDDSGQEASRSASFNPFVSSQRVPKCSSAALGPRRGVDEPPGLGVPLPRIGAGGLWVSTFVCGPQQFANNSCQHPGKARSINHLQISPLRTNKLQCFVSSSVCFLFVGGGGWPKGKPKDAKRTNRPFWATFATHPEYLQYIGSPRVPSKQGAANAPSGIAENCTQPKSIQIIRHDTPAFLKAEVFVYIS